MKMLKLDSVIGEIKFQKNEMIKYMRGWSIDEETIEMASDYFENAIHGIEDHLINYEIEK